MDIDRVLELAEMIKAKRAELAALESELAGAAGATPHGPKTGNRRGRPGNKAEQVAELLRRNPGAPMTPKEISEKLPGVKQKYAQLLVVQLERAGKIARVGPGRYQAKQ